MRRFRIQVSGCAGMGCVIALVWVALCVLQINYREQSRSRTMFGWDAWPSAFVGFFLAFVPIIGNVLAYPGRPQNAAGRLALAAIVFFAAPAVALLSGWIALAPVRALRGVERMNEDQAAQALISPDLAAALYLVSGVLFILALRGLSSPETSRRGNKFGMAGMAIAIAVTLALVRPDPTTIGDHRRRHGDRRRRRARSSRGTIKMTAMPQLVAAFHSLVGLAAVAVAAAAFYAPESFGISLPLGTYGERGIQMQSLIELSLGTAIGAVTFTGSVIAFAKLNGNMSGAPIILPARHLLNIAIAVGIVALIVMMINDAGRTEWHFWAIVRAFAP